MATIEVKAKPGEKVWVLAIRPRQGQSRFYVVGQRVIDAVHQQHRGSTWYYYRCNGEYVHRLPHFVHRTKAEAQAEAERRNKEGR